MSELERHDIGTYDEPVNCAGDPHATWGHHWRRDPSSPPGWVYYRCPDCGALEDIWEDDLISIDDLGAW